MLKKKKLPWLVFIDFFSRGKITKGSFSQDGFQKIIGHGFQGMVFSKDNWISWFSKDGFSGIFLVIFFIDSKECGRGINILSL
jgi:hypothetical protein